MAKSNNLTVSLAARRGMWSGGDAADIPQEYARRLRNILNRSGTLAARPQFTYDAVAAVRALGVWDDLTNGQRRLVAIGGTGALSVKDLGAETYASGGSMTGAGDMLDAFSYRGELFMLGGTSAHAPAGMFSYNGLTTDISVYLSGSVDAALWPATACIFKERAYYGGASLTFVNFLHQPFGTDYTYNAANWTRTNITAETFTANGQTVCRITPTNTSTASMIVPLADSVPAGLFQADTVRWIGELRNTSATYRMPITAQWKYVNAWLAATTVAAGNVVVPATANGFRYRCAIAGTTGAVAPAWPTTIGTTVADNTVTWVCDATDVAASVEAYLPTSSESQDFVPFAVAATIPSGAAAVVAPFIKFGTAAVGTITLAAVDFSLKDGRSDGDPSKRNHGHQVTTGTMAVPFVNRDSAGDYTPEPSGTLFISKVGEPISIETTFRLPDTPGAITAVRSGVSGRLLVFKRSAAYIFGAVADDARLVILPESDARTEFGCLGPKAFAAFEDRAYFIGENEVYAWSVGKDPQPLCGDAMRDEIMNKSAASWCESQAAPANRALLTIDQRNREMWVYTQKGRLYCHNLDAGPGAGWTVHDAGGGDSLSPVGYEICDMAYNPTTGNMYFAFTSAASGTAGVARLDPTVTPAQDSISDSGTLPVHAEIWPRPIEASTPAVDVRVDTLRFYHKVTADQAGQTTTGSISFDHGVSFPKSLTFNLAPLSSGGFVPLQFPVYQSYATVLTRLAHIGKGGASNFTISRIEADIHVMRGHYPKSKISGAGNL